MWDENNNKMLKTEKSARALVSNPVFFLKRANSSTQHVQRQAHIHHTWRNRRALKRVIHVSDAEDANRSNNRYKARRAMDHTER
jgi:hypothetical protein